MWVEKVVGVSRGAAWVREGAQKEHRLERVHEGVQEVLHGSGKALGWVAQVRGVHRSDMGREQFVGFIPPCSSLPFPAGK